jgi:hypothetical protein
MEGAAEKVLPFKMPLKYIYKKYFGFNEPKSISEHYRMVKIYKTFKMPSFRVFKGSVTFT